MPKPSEKIKDIFNTILSEDVAIENIPEKFTPALLQAIIKYLDDDYEEKKPECHCV